jgi:hypothetical protein
MLERIGLRWLVFSHAIVLATRFQPHPAFPDGTKLAFGAGTVVLQGDEWFTAAQATPVLIEFLGGELLPASAPGCRDATDLIFDK